MQYLIVGYGNVGQKRKNILAKKCAATVDPNPTTQADYKNIKDVPISIFNAAVLTIPQKLKFKLTKYFLKLGKHVLVEKPLMLSKSQAKLLSEIAKKNNVIWYTSYNHRFEPNIVKLKKIISNGFPGKLYHARFVYSFGNIKERLGTWRETKFGVLEEIIPHQLDFVMNFFGYQGAEFKTMIARKVESKIFDHWMIDTIDQKIIIECSAVTWKNVFSIDIYGERGSIHVEGLRKWGGSELILRERGYPSGVPKEKRSFDKGPDLTWKKDFAYFEKMVRENETSLDNDLQISIALAKIKEGGIT